MSKNVNTEELYEELGVLNKTISSLEEYLKELGNDCNTIYNYAHELKSYHGKMVANSKKIVDNGDGGVTSTVSYQLFKVNVGKELLNYSDGVSSCLKDIQEGLNKMKTEIQNNFGSLEQIEQEISEIEVTVNPGDTLSKIAQQYGFTYEELAEHNNIDNPNLINVGQIIKIPLLVNKIESKDSSNNSDSKKNNDYEEYVVQPGDSLMKIAKEKLGDSSRYMEIATLTGITNPNLLNIGDKLLIPKEKPSEDIKEEVISKTYVKADRENAIVPFDHIDNHPGMREARIKELTGCATECPTSSDFSQAEIEKQMVTIDIPVYNGKETATRKIIVHEKLANNVEGIFNELAEKKFPIEFSNQLDGGRGNYEVEGYEYRTTGSGRLSDHSWGAAIDINAVHNPMVHHPQDALVENDGSPYAVTEEVVEIFAKYGYFWGGNWNESSDPMHFCYTGW